MSVFTGHPKLPCYDDVNEHHGHDAIVYKCVYSGCQGVFVPQTHVRHGGDGHARGNEFGHWLHATTDQVLHAKAGKGRVRKLWGDAWDVHVWWNKLGGTGTRALNSQ